MSFVQAHALKRVGRQAVKGSFGLAEEDDAASFYHSVTDSSIASNALDDGTDVMANPSHHRPLQLATV